MCNLELPRISVSLLKIAMASIVFLLGHASSTEAQTSCSNILISKVDTHSEVQKIWAEKIETNISPSLSNQLLKSTNLYFKSDLNIEKANRTKEVTILEDLGFEINPSEIKVPSFLEFIKRYDHLLTNNHIPEQYKIRPSLAFINRGDGEQTSYTLIRPNIDPYPLTANYYVSKDARLKGRDMLKNVAKGKYPVFFNGIHDIFHFVTFALYPDYLIGISKGHQNLENLPLTTGRGFRLAYALEILTLSDPKKLTEIQSILSVKNPTKSTTYAEFEREINALPTEQLISKAKTLIENYQQYLNKYAAGMAEAKEHRVYADMWTPERVFRHFYERQYFVSSRVLPFDSLSEGMAHMDTVLKIILKLHKPEYTHEFSNRNLDAEVERSKMLRLQLTRMEYALWTSANTVTVKQFLEDTLSPELNPTSATARFISNVYGQESITYRLFTQK